jgi:hypothetical protein
MRLPGDDAPLTGAVTRATVMASRQATKAAPSITYTLLLCCFMRFLPVHGRSVRSRRFSAVSVYTTLTAEIAESAEILRVFSAVSAYSLRCKRFADV